MKDIYLRYKEEGLTPEVIDAFREVIRGHDNEFGRDFPWRETRDPYHILVSEVMLQQTQTSRAIDKFTEFITVFPDVYTLADAPLLEVLQVWQGLGYNRRAKSLQAAARKIVDTYSGKVPSDPEQLLALPGIGPYTAGAVAAIAYDTPMAFIDTNIRTIFHYFFFREREKVSDKELMPVIDATFDRDNPRTWVYALFDYGVMLKKRKKDLPESSVKKQSRFRGSDREIRGKVIRLLLDGGSMSEADLAAQFPDDTHRLSRIVQRLHDEGLIRNEAGIVRIV